MRTHIVFDCLEERSSGWNLQSGVTVIVFANLKDLVTQTVASDENVLSSENESVGNKISLKESGSFDPLKIQSISFLKV